MFQYKVLDFCAKNMQEKSMLSRMGRVFLQEINKNFYMPYTGRFFKREC